MKSLFETKDIILLLDSSGKIIEIENARLDLIEFLPGSSLMRYINDQFHTYFLETLRECHASQFAVGDEIIIETKQGAKPTSFILMQQGSNIHFINLNESQKTMSVLADIIRINNELTNAIRRNFQTARIDSEYYENLQEVSKLNSELVNMQRMMTQKNRELTRLNKILESLSYKDDLTGIGNRRKFFRDVNQINEDENYLLILIDFNNFKRVNDTKGHEYGDHVLRTFATELQALVQTCGGEIYRIGGDEFSAIIPESSCNKIENQFLTINDRLKELHPEISIAYGGEIITNSAVREKKIEYFMSRIDMKMYANKASNKAIYNES